MKYVLLPRQFSDVMQGIGEWFVKTYPFQVVPEYSISAFVTVGRLPSFLRFTTAKYDKYVSQGVFYYPYAWVTYQVVLANQVLYASILKSDIPPETEADGVGLVHRHPLPGMCSPEDCTFGVTQDDPVVANVVWSDAYNFNHGFVCGCTEQSGEDETEVITYDVNELECILEQCTDGRVPERWYKQALSPLELSRIVVFPELGREYIMHQFGLDKLFKGSFPF